PRLLLLRDGVELPNNWSIGQLGIGITDIIGESSVFIRFTSQMSPEKRKSVRFLFDGCKVLPHQTPAQLDMEDGDIIEYGGYIK
uniref:Rad60/SUMO-like domain-containing protein n=1 Tax=Gouania willdenowi TaxID=441366 RepID=A0A8C5GKU3_GOUWI